MNNTKYVILYVYEASKIKLCWEKTHNHPNNLNLDKTMIKDVLQDKKGSPTDSKLLSKSRVCRIQILVTCVCIM